MILEIDNNYCFLFNLELYFNVLLNFKIEKTNKKCVDSFDIPEINERKEISNKTGLILKPGEKIS